MEVERVPTASLMNVVNRCVQDNNMTFLHSYDDLDLIAGHARYRIFLLLSSLNLNIDPLFV